MRLWMDALACLVLDGRGAAFAIAMNGDLGLDGIEGAPSSGDIDSLLTSLGAPLPAQFAWPTFDLFPLIDPSW